MSSKHTTIGSWAIVIARALDSYGCNGEAICREHGVNLTEASDPNIRFSTDKMSALWTHATEVSADPLFGIRAGTYVSPSTFYALSVSMWMSATLLEALQCMERNLRVFTTAVTGNIREIDDFIVLNTAVQRDDGGQAVITQQAHEASISALISLCRALCGPEFSPVKVELDQANDSLIKQYESFFKCPVEGKHTDICLYFDKKTMLETLPTANMELFAHNERLMFDYLARLDKSDVVNQVRVKLVELLPSGEPSRALVADSLNMSLRNLQRKLQQENTSYKELLDEVRHDLAKQFIQQSHLTLGEISYRLGFSTYSSFTRAFKRWTGEPPGDYRKHLSCNSKHIDTNS